jgi:hypothetical protein
MVKAPVGKEARRQPKRNKDFHGFRSLVLQEFVDFGPPFSFKAKEAEVPFSLFEWREGYKRTTLGRNELL